MPNEKDAEIKSRYEDYSVEELRAALDSIFDSTDEFSDSDVEQMDEIMAVLDKKNPLSQRYTAEESWKHFQENYREELSRLGVRTNGEVMEEEAGKAVETDAAAAMPIAHAEKVHAVPASTESRHGKRGQSLIRTAMIAAAVVALMVIVTVSAAAAGIDIWRWVPVRNGGTFQFVPEDAISKDIPNALKQNGIEELLFPTWLPEGFILDEQQIFLETPMTINAVYMYRDRVLVISIKEIIDNYKTGWAEIDEGETGEYVKNGITHYIFSNYDTVISTWHIEKYLVRISGDVSNEEMKKMIDSVYEVKR